VLPSELNSTSFAHYSERARNQAISNLACLRELPLPLAAALLGQLAKFDWLFPAEQDTVTRQLETLAALKSGQRAQIVSQFAALKMTSELAALDWVNDPKGFSEAMTAYLWASHQIDAFHAAATSYASYMDVSFKGSQLPMRRTSIVVFPNELEKPGYLLFRKLRTQGVFFDNVTAESGFIEVLAWSRERAEKHAEPFAHIYIDGADPLPSGSTSIDTISWAGVKQVRDSLLQRIQRMMMTPGVGPEKARTRMASLSPSDFGLEHSGNAAVMDRFALSVLTEGSGTQIFSTTFAQWAAREALRRAQPLTLIVRFGPRQRLQPMNQMLSGKSSSLEFDLPGSLVDADMAAYYTWINQQRLAGSDSSAFIAWSEARRQAIVIGPGLPQNSVSSGRISLSRILSLLG